MSAKQLHNFPVKKLLAAIIAVAISLVGIVLEMRWLTVVALVVWAVAVTMLGPGKRGERTQSVLSEGEEERI